MNRTGIAPSFLASMFRYWTCAAVVLTSVVPVAGQEAPPGPVRPARLADPSEIAGTVSLNGFTGDATAIAIQAVPLGVKSSDGKRFDPDPRATIKSARLQSTGARTFTFSIKGLQPAALYRLGVRFPPNPVRPKVFWRGPLDGIALSGGGPVALEGFVARTELEILDKDGDWVGADDLQFTDPAAAVRTLRWKSSVPGVVAGELQIATSAFPLRDALDPCAESPGTVIYRKVFSVREGGWQGISSLDFNEILSPTRIPGDAIDGGISPAGAGVGTADVAPLTDADFRMLGIGAPIYLRVVPVTDAGRRACNVGEDGVNGWLILGKLPLGDLLPGPDPKPDPMIKASGGSYLSPRVEWGYTRGVPTYGEVAYRVIKEHKLPDCNSGLVCAMFPGYMLEDPIGTNLLATGFYAGGTVLPVNTFIHFTPVTITSDGGAFANFVNTVGSMGAGLVTGAVGFAGDAVNFLSRLTQEIKTAVASVVADVLTDLPLIGDACNLVTSCQNLVEMGMNYGLASMGIPPSLPNWDQLKEQGMDYLAAELSSQISAQTGLPDAITQLGVDEAMALAKGMAEKSISEISEHRGGEDPRYNWVIPSLGIEPAVWKLGVSANGAYQIPSDLYIRTLGNGLYLPAQVRIPTMFPSNSFLSIPVVLYPDKSGILPPLCRPEMGTISCQPRLATKPLCQTSQYNWTTHAWEWIDTDCVHFGNAVDVYYRDAWVTQKLRTSGCVNLAASSYQRQWWLWLSMPVPPYVDFVQVLPTQDAYYSAAGFVYPGCNVLPPFWWQ